MELKAKANIKQAIEIVNNDTGEIEFLTELDGKWVKIDHNQYQQIIRGE